VYSEIRLGPDFLPPEPYFIVQVLRLERLHIAQRPS